MSGKEQHCLFETILHLVSSSAQHKITLPSTFGLLVLILTHFS